MWSLTTDSFPKKMMAHHSELSKCMNEIATLVKTRASLEWYGYLLDGH